MSTKTETAVSRRALLASAGMGGIAAWMLSGSATAAKTTPAEQSNVDLVTRFILGWTRKGYDANQEMATYLTSPCLVRAIEDQPSMTTPAAAASVFTEFMKDGSRVSRVDFHGTHVIGPVVMNRRTDVVSSPGKADVNYEVVGIFLVRDGKIKEWVDYHAT